MIASSDELWQQYKEGRSPQKERARDGLLELHFHIVKFTAERLSRGKKNLGESLDIDDLIQEGTIALMGCFDRYDPKRGVGFQTYVQKPIFGAMMDYIRKNSSRSRLDFVRMIDYEKAASQARSLSENGQISNEELMKQTELTQKELMRAKQNSQNYFMTNMSDISILSGYSGEEIKWADYESRRFADPRTAILSNSIKEYLVRGLNGTERLVILLYYYEDMNMVEIGKTLDLSESRVSQVHHRVLERLRERRSEIEKEIA